MKIDPNNLNLLKELNRMHRKKRTVDRRALYDEHIRKKDSIELFEYRERDTSRIVYVSRMDALNLPGFIRTTESVGMSF